MADNSASPRRLKRNIEYGPLLKRFRSRSGISQTELGISLDPPLKFSDVSGIEISKKNPPESERLEQINKLLNLNPIDRQRMRFAALGCLKKLNGSIPLSMDDIGEEFSSNKYIWVIGSNPPEYQSGKNPVYDAVLLKMQKEEGSMTYWTNAGSILRFKHFAEKLKRDLGEKKGLVDKMVRCIEVPDVLCLHHSVIYNPFGGNLIGGRYGVQNDIGEITKMISLPKTSIDKIVDILEEPAKMLVDDKNYITFSESRFEKRYPV